MAIERHVSRNASDKKVDIISLDFGRDIYASRKKTSPHIYTLPSAFIDEMRDEVENMPGDLAPSKIVHDEKRLDRVLKENRALVMRCKELEIKLESR